MLFCTGFEVFNPLTLNDSQIAFFKILLPTTTRDVPTYHPYSYKINQYKKP